MINILFVDDESSILRSIKRILFHVDEDWNIETAGSGKEALEMFEVTRYDIVVSDMRMPEMNGAKLLEQIKERYPWTVRFILSGYSDMNSILRTVHTAEQFLAKPMAPEELIETLKNTIKAYQIIENDKVRDRISDFEILPAQPSIYMELCSALEEENVKLDKIAEIIEKDVVLTSKLLKLVNSAFFGLRTHIESVKDAIKYLGFDVIKAVSLTTNLYSSSGDIRGKDVIEAINNESIHRAQLSTEIMKEQKASDNEVKEAFLTSMLSDIGKLVFLQNDYDKYYPIVSNDDEEDPWHTQHEIDLFGVSHSDVSAYLLGKWGFSPRIVDNVRYHHRPYKRNEKEVSPIMSVYRAQDIVMAKRFGDFEEVEDET